ncbi:MAG: hypothetical protein V3R87_02780 [Dehalococcoidia bacterium]
MEQPSSGTKESGASGWKRTSYLIVILCVVAVVATVGSLSPGGSDVPTIGEGNILYSDDFSDDRNGWMENAGTAAYIDGQLHLINDNPGRSAPLWFYTPAEFDNIAFEVDATKVAGPDQQYGLIFGTENEDFFLFGLTENGLYCFTRWTGSDWFYIVDYVFSPHIKQGGAANTVSVARRDGGLEFYVNGEYLRTVDWRSDIMESIGLFVGTEGMHVSFDNVKVFELQ